MLANKADKPFLYSQEEYCNTCRAACILETPVELKTLLNFFEESAWQRYSSCRALPQTQSVTRHVHRILRLSLSLSSRLTSRIVDCQSNLFQCSSRGSPAVNHPMMIVCRSLIARVHSYFADVHQQIRLYRGYALDLCSTVPLIPLPLRLKYWGPLVK